MGGHPFAKHPTTLLASLKSRSQNWYGENDSL